MTLWDTSCFHVRASNHNYLYDLMRTIEFFDSYRLLFLLAVMNIDRMTLEHTKDSKDIQKSIAITDPSLLSHKRNLCPKLLLRAYYKVCMSFSVALSNLQIMASHFCAGNMKSTVTKWAYCTRYFLPVLADSVSSTLSNFLHKNSFINLCTQTHTRLVLGSRSWMKPLKKVTYFVTLSRCWH